MLLPNIIEKLIKLDKPFIVENVRNEQLFIKEGLYDNNLFIYKIGRHTYWTNIMINFYNIKQTFDYVAINKRVKGKRGYFITPSGKIVKSAGQNLKKNISPKHRQGGKNVYRIIEHWLEVIHS